MATFLFKTEPSTYSFDRLVKEKHALWDGISNNAALLALRGAKKGDEAFIYHTGDEKAIVGLAKITTDAYEDPKSPGKNDLGLPRVSVVEIKPVKGVKTPVTLSQLKADKRFKDFALIKQSRLSVMLVPPELDKLLRQMAGL